MNVRLVLCLLLTKLGSIVNYSGEKILYTGEYGLS